MEDMPLLPQGEFYPLYSCIAESLFGRNKMKMEKVVGSGMSSHVVLARSSTPPFDDRAVKILPLNGNVDLQKKLFFNEVLAMRSFNHRHLMKAVCAYEHPHRLYISMPYCPFGSLGNFVGDLDFATTELFLVQLASAAKHMHGNRYAHTDIKLANILLRAPDHVLLSDFGICCKMPEEFDEIPSSYVGGTMFYTAPEKAQGDPHRIVNPMKMDMYSLGVVLKAMIDRCDPETPDQTAARSRMENDVPEILQFCLENLLKEDYRERFSSKRLMVTLLARSQWRSRARELESISMSG